MAAATPRPGKQRGQQPAKQSPHTHPPGLTSPPETVDPVWLLKAAGIVIAAALVCGYLTLCLLFYQGQWQLVLHPGKSRAAPATIAGTTYETVRFGVDESGVPQLSGWWIPADSGGRYEAKTVLYLPSGEGSLEDALPRLSALHSLGINIFAIDYRGFGQSAQLHPNELRMTQDTLSAWRYLTVSRQIPATTIIPFGEGVGAALAAQLASSQASIPGVILQSPRTDLLRLVLDDPRTRLLPVRALFHERFEIADTVNRLTTPKLFLLPADDAASLHASRAAAQPKTIVTLPPSPDISPAYLEQIARFLDQIAGKARAEAPGSR